MQLMAPMKHTSCLSYVKVVVYFLCGSIFLLSSCDEKSRRKSDSSSDKTSEQAIQKELSLVATIDQIFKDLKSEGVTTLTDESMSSDTNIALQRLLVLDPTFREKLSKIVGDYPKSQHLELIKKAGNECLREAQYGIRSERPSLLACALQSNYNYKATIEDARENMLFITFDFPEDNPPIYTTKSFISYNSEHENPLEKGGRLLSKLILKCEFQKAQNEKGESFYFVTSEKIVPDSNTLVPIPPLTNKLVVKMLNENAFLKVPYLRMPEDAFGKGVWWTYTPPGLSKPTDIPKKLKDDLSKAGLKFSSVSKNRDRFINELYFRVVYPESFKEKMGLNKGHDVSLLSASAPQMIVGSKRGFSFVPTLAWKADSDRCSVYYEYTYKKNTTRLDHLKSISDVVNANNVNIRSGNSWSMNNEYEYLDSADFTWIPRKGWKCTTGGQVRTNTPYYLNGKYRIVKKTQTGSTSMMDINE